MRLQVQPLSTGRDTPVTARPAAEQRKATPSPTDLAGVASAPRRHVTDGGKLLGLDCPTRARGDEGGGRPRSRRWRCAAARRESHDVHHDRLVVRARTARATLDGVRPITHLPLPGMS